eukprot:scaffold685_cov281-Pinguiococcus_pyrenoidosus.AAC.23
MLWRWPPRLFAGHVHARCSGGGIGQGTRGPHTSSSKPLLMASLTVISVARERIFCTSGGADLCAMVGLMACAALAPARESILSKMPRRKPDIKWREQTGGALPHFGRLSNFLRTLNYELDTLWTLRAL